VIISGAGATKLLDNPKLRGAGEEMAKAVVNYLEDWNIKVQALLFDTAVLALLLELVHSSS